VTDQPRCRCTLGDLSTDAPPARCELPDGHDGWHRHGNTGWDLRVLEGGIWDLDYCTYVHPQEAS
jgi:hypothetical protein